MRWRAFYADGSRYSSAEMHPQELPPEGMVGVVEYAEQEWKPGHPYRRIIDGGDWFWFDGGWQRVMTHDEWGQWAPAPEGVPSIRLKRGAPMEDGAWAAVQAEMMAARMAP